MLIFRPHLQIASQPSRTSRPHLFGWLHLAVHCNLSDSNVHQNDWCQKACSSPDLIATFRNKPSLRLLVFLDTVLRCSLWESILYQRLDRLVIDRCWNPCMHARFQTHIDDDSCLCRQLIPCMLRYCIYCMVQDNFVHQTSSDWLVIGR